MPPLPSARARVPLALNDGNLLHLRQEGEGKGEEGGALFAATDPSTLERAKGFGGGGLKTYTRRRTQTTAAAAAAPHELLPERLADNLKSLALQGADEEEGEDTRDAADDAGSSFDDNGGAASGPRYDGPYDDSDSDCGGPGSALKQAAARGPKKTFVSRHDRLARNAAAAAADHQRDDAAVRANLAERREFFAQVDAYSLASETASLSPSSRASSSAAAGPPSQPQQQQRRTVGGGGGGISRAVSNRDADVVIGGGEKAAATTAVREEKQARDRDHGPSRQRLCGGGGGGGGGSGDDAEDPYAPTPTTPGTKHALTREWLSAIPATFSPAMSDRMFGESPTPSGGGEDEERAAHLPASAPRAPGNHRRITLSTLREDAAPSEDGEADAKGEGLDGTMEAREQPASAAARTAAAATTTPGDPAAHRRFSAFGDGAGPGDGGGAGPGTASRRRRSSLVLARRVSSVAIVVPAGGRRSSVAPTAVAGGGGLGHFTPGANVDFQPGGGIRIHSHHTTGGTDADVNAVEFHRLSLGRPSLSGAAAAAARLSFGAFGGDVPATGMGRHSVAGRPSLAPDGAHETLVELDEEDEDTDEDGDVYIEEEFSCGDDEEEVEEEAEAEDGADAASVVVQKGEEATVEVEALVMPKANASDVMRAATDSSGAFPLSSTAAPSPAAPVSPAAAIAAIADGVTDVTAALAEVALAAGKGEGGDEDEDEGDVEDAEELSPLAALLRECGQAESDVLPMADAVKSFITSGVKKIGEGTFGEAFKGNGLVLKVVPMVGRAGAVPEIPRVTPCSNLTHRATPSKAVAWRWMTHHLNPSHAATRIHAPATFSHSVDLPLTSAQHPLHLMSPLPHGRRRAHQRRPTDGRRWGTHGGCHRQATH
jgi:hypothetical protein